MTIYSRQDVLQEAKNLASMLAHTEEIERFKVLEAKINENEKVQELISQIKHLQKQAVNLQAYDKKEAVKKIDEKIDRIQDELDEIPIVQEFKEIQIVVNDVLQLVSSTIARKVTNHINIDTGYNLYIGTVEMYINKTTLDMK